MSDSVADQLDQEADQDDIREQADAEKEGELLSEQQDQENQERYQAAMDRGYQFMGGLLALVDKFAPYVSYGDEDQVKALMDRGATRTADVLVKYDIPEAPGWYQKWEPEIKWACSSDRSRSLPGGKSTNTRKQKKKLKRRMATMAVNQNPSLPNKHTLYCATSGGGKTQAMASNLPRVKTKILFWDTHKTFRADSADTVADFKRKVAAGIRGKKTFRISFTGRGTPENFDQFCKVAWMIADGNQVLHVVIDELSEVTDKGKALKYFGELLRGGRKFGVILHISANALPEVPTTVRRETMIKWAGIQQTYTDKKLLADFMSVKPEEFDKLEPLTFLVSDKRTVTVKKIKYKNPPL